jgi:hypothetical protein
MLLLFSGLNQVSTLRNAGQSRIFRGRNLGQQHVSNNRHQNFQKVFKAYSFLYKNAHMFSLLLMMLTSHTPATGLCSGYTPSTQQTCCFCTSQFGSRHQTKPTLVNCPTHQDAAKARPFDPHTGHSGCCPVTCPPATPALGLQVK